MTSSQWDSNDRWPSVVHFEFINKKAMARDNKPHDHHTKNLLFQNLKFKFDSPKSHGDLD